MMPAEAKLPAGTAAMSCVNVSVVIPAYNSAATLDRALASVAAQTRTPAEVLVIDDASSDDTIAVATRFAARSDSPPIRVIRHTRNLGPAAARNSGWNDAKCGYVAFLDADDAWHPRKLEIQHGWMAAHPEVGLSGHACPQRQQGDWPVIAETVQKVRHLCAGRFLLSNQFSTPTAMVCRVLPYRFQAEKRYAEDYLLWLQMVLDRVPVAYFDLPLAVIHKPAYGAAGLSGRLWAMERGELETYWQLRRERRLGGVAASLLSGLSLAKYARRRLLVALRALRGQ